MNIQFIKSPITTFNLAYLVGDTAEVRDTLASELIESGYAIEVPENAASKEVIEVPKVEAQETAVVNNVIEIPEKKKGKK